MRETPGLSRPSVNRHPDVDDVLDFSEEVVQVAIAHVKGHVADEEGPGGCVDWTVAWHASGPAGSAHAGCGE